MANDPHIGGLYVSPQKDRIPNASAVHSVARDENGNWKEIGSILCLFRVPIVLIDKWTKPLSKRANITYYIAIYEDKTIAIPPKWITDKIYERVEDGQL